MTKRTADRAPRPIDWEAVTSSPDRWASFCTLTGFRVIGLAVQRVREHGGGIPEAFDQTVEEVAAEMERDGPPAGLVKAFREQYRADRANQIATIAMNVEIVREAEASRRKRRRKPAAS